MKNVEVKFTGKHLTGNAGLIHIGRFANQIGLQSILEEKLTLQRAANATYQVADVILMVMLGVLAGAQHMSHLSIIGGDSVLCRIFQWAHFPVASTLSRIFKRFTHKYCHEVSEAEEILRQKVGKKRWVGRVTMDFDSTVKGVFGNQEGARKGYHPTKKGQKSSHPLLCCIAESRECFHNWFRSGKTYSAKGRVEFIKECFARLPKRVWKVGARGDSAFFDGALLDLLEERHTYYAIKVAMKGLVKLLEAQTWRGIKRSSDWEATVFFHHCSGWKHPRRFVAVRHRVETLKTEGLFPVIAVTYEYFCDVTNLSWNPWGIHRYYGQRATSEHWIEWCKNQMAASSMLTQAFWANSALFQTCMLAYNLFVWMIWLTMKQALREEPNTIRFWLIPVPAKFVERGRRCFLNVSRDWLAKGQWGTLENALAE